MSRQDCLKWYEGKGFKIPVKSACIGCPFHDDNFWIDMRNNRPEEFANAVEFDKKMRMHNPKVKNYVHRSCVPLDEVNLKMMTGQIYLTMNVRVCAVFRNVIIQALEDRYNAQISEAEATLKIYLEKPVGIGEHPQHIDECDKLIEKISNAEEKLETLQAFKI